MKLVLAASRSAPIEIAIPYAIEELSKLSTEDRVLLRRPVHEEPADFEWGVARAATRMGLEPEWWAPEPGIGREATFVRDVKMVEAADEVVVYFTETEEMSGGTGHVVEKCLDQKVPCRAYSLVDGHLRWVGGYDPSTED